ncbi:protein Wnt-2b [Hydra vulgaris]|uniref:Protein Wnt n=1 Tax=Hydra vulgaris TaxID=6087 RepID=A0ABM4D8W4_HYDVU
MKHRNLAFNFFVQTWLAITIAYNGASFGDEYKKKISSHLCKNEYKYKITQPMLDLCKEQAYNFGYAINGFNRGITECQSLFTNQRWNCSTFDVDSEFTLFNTVMSRGSKEAAVQMAMASAGMIEGITASLRRKKKPTTKDESGCNTQLAQQNPGEYYSECDADLTIGNRFANLVIKTWQPQTNQEEVQMNEHNSYVGKMAVQLNMQKVCRCAGISGNCVTKCCYQTLKPLKVSAQWLQAQYSKAQKVVRSQRVRRDGRYLLVNEKDGKEPANTDLIYILDSPDYCNHDINKNSLGTTGRLCNNTSLDTNGCEYMCCGRGYVTEELNVDDFCKCKFNWCCDVTCDRCKKTVTRHICK